MGEKWVNEIKVLACVRSEKDVNYTLFPLKIYKSRMKGDF